MRKSGARLSPCGYSLLIAVITAVASWMIAITKGSHFFYFLPFQWFHLLTPFIPYIVYKKQLFILIFTNKKAPHHVQWPIITLI